MSSATLTSVNTACSVTNNSETPVVVLDAFGSANSVATNQPGKGYQQTLKTLPLTEGGDVLAPGASGTVTLDDTYTNSKGQTQQSLIYQLLVSDAASLFPVMNVGEAIDFSTMTYPPIAVSAAAAANMRLALTFVQSIRAYPSSNLATGFQTAMTQAQAQPTTTAMMQTIANWFNTTNTFKGLDFPSYLAVSTFVDSFAWVWGLGDDNATPGRTYWVYTTAGAGQQPNGKEAPNEGSIVFAHSGPSPADPTDRNSGYTITYTPSDGAPKTLTFSNGQFVDDPTSDLPAVVLQGSWALKSQYTQVQSDNVLWPVLTGTVNGTQVIAVSQAPETWWQKNISSKTFGDWCELGLKILGAAMALEWLYNKLAGKSEKLENDRVNENRGADPNPQQQAAADQAGDDVGNAELGNVRQAAGRMGNADNVPDDEASLDELIESIKSDMVDVLNEIQTDLYDSMIDGYDAQLQDLAEIEVNSDIEEAMSSLAEAKQNLADAIESGDFDAAKSSLADVKASIGSAMENMDISEELRAQLEQSQEMLDEYQDTADEADDVKDDIENGDDPLEDIDAA